jgi:NADPH oxidase
MFNFAALTKPSPTLTKRILAFLSANFLTGPGATGWIMTLCLGIIVWFATEKRRSRNYEQFWYTHHLFIPLFICWQLHGMFCMIKPDRPPFCSWNTIGVFWVGFSSRNGPLHTLLTYINLQRYWLLGGVIWIGERILREIRSRHITYIHKVIQHPSNVMELQIKKEKITTRAGQYVYLCCPEISYFQWHPFTLTRYDLVDSCTTL